MKSHSLKLKIFVPMLIVCSISCSTIHPPSQFLNSFSLTETIKLMNVSDIELSSCSGTLSASAGDPSPHRREFCQDIAITESKADSFDETDFLAKLQEKVEQEVIKSGVRVNGVGTGDNNFHIDYSNGKHQGGVEVIGARTEKNKYRVWCIVREIAPAAPRKN